MQLERNYKINRPLQFGTIKLYSKYKTCCPDRAEETEQLSDFSITKKTDDVFRKRDVLSENKRMNPQEAGGRPADGARGWTGLKLAL